MHRRWTYSDGLPFGPKMGDVVLAGGLRAVQGST